MAENRPLSDISGSIAQGVAAGADLGAKMAHIQAQREQVELQKQDHELKLSNYELGKLNQIAMLDNDKLREKYLDRLRGEMDQFGRVRDPELYEVIMAPENRTNLKKSLAHIFGATGPQQAQMMNGFASALATTDPLKAPETLQTFVQAVNQSKEAETKRMAMESKPQGPTHGDILTQTMDVKTKFHNEHKSDYEVINLANQITTDASDKGNRKSPQHGMAALVRVAKILDPMSVARTGEVDAQTGLDTGFLKKINNYLTEKITGRNLSENQWKEITSLVSSQAYNADERIQADFKELAPLVQRAGLPPAAVTSAIPKIKVFDFKKNFGSVPPAMKEYAKKYPLPADSPEKPPVGDVPTQTATTEAPRPSDNVIARAKLAEQKRLKAASTAAAPAALPTANVNKPLVPEPVLPEAGGQ